MSFVHLHVHSEYSLRDGLPSVDALVNAAVAMDMPALALTDHGVMYGAVAFYRAAVKKWDKDKRYPLAMKLNPIIGMEAYLAPRRIADKTKEDRRAFHLVLLAQNDQGYHNLLKLASIAQLEGFYYNPRIDLEILAQHADGLIATTACLSGEVPRAILEDDLQKARAALGRYVDIFGRERFFVELQSHNIPELDKVNPVLVQLAKEFGLRVVATNDVHYLRREDAYLQDVLIAIQSGKILREMRDQQRAQTDPTYYLRSPQEMAALFAEIPEAISNTLLVAEMCHVDFQFKDYKIPNYDVPPGYTAETYLRHLCEQGLRARYGARAQAPEVRQRLNEELEIIHKMGFDHYFLIVWNLVQKAREKGIWYNARGSAAGSIVAYTLEITMVDPLEHGLIFERFLNPGRISMPDIDLDFQDDRRDEMMRYCIEKYGDPQVAQIITFGTMKARAAIRDVGRVLDIPLGEVDKIAKLVPNVPGKPISLDEVLGFALKKEERKFAEEQRRRESAGKPLSTKEKEAWEEKLAAKRALVVPELVALYEEHDYVRELLDTARAMEGVIRNVGTHAAGVVITDKPLESYVPLHRSTNKDADQPINKITQYEMSILDELGLLKVDFLGLATLTVMAKASQLIEARHGVHYDLYNIPTDDPAAYRLLANGETAGVFQVEGQGMSRYLMEMKPTRLEHVIAMVALYRPGPMQFIDSYIKRMHGEEKPTYLHPALEPIFAETYGIAVYQEQIMRAAMELAGFSAQNADFLRKAIAKKKRKELEEHARNFVKGAVERNIPRETAEEIFHDWQEFARYGFNKSHAADYAVIAVQTAFLKARYPVEYMTALMSVVKHNTDKVAYYVQDCQRMGIPVLPPDVNASEWDFVIEDQEDGAAAIRFAFGAIKNVGRGHVAPILEARHAGGPFQDLTDFVYRVDLRRVNRKALESLILAGALDALGDRQRLLAGLDRLVDISAAHFRAKEAGQLSLFAAASVRQPVTLPAPREPRDRKQMLDLERQLIGVYLSGHPLDPMREVLTKAVTHFAPDLHGLPPRTFVWVGGMITDRRVITTKKGEEMAFAQLEDLRGVIDLVLFPRAWEAFGAQVVPGRVVLAHGQVDDSRGGTPKILVDAVETTFQVVKDEETGRVVGVKHDVEPLPLWSRRQGDQARKAAAKKAQAAPKEGGLPAASSSEPVETSPEPPAPPAPEAFPRGWLDEATDAAADGAPAGPAAEEAPPAPPRVAEPAALYIAPPGEDAAPPLADADDPPVEAEAVPGEDDAPSVAEVDAPPAASGDDDAPPAAEAASGDDAAPPVAEADDPPAAPGDDAAPPVADAEAPPAAPGEDAAPPAAEAASGDDDALPVAEADAPPAPPGEDDAPPVAEAEAEAPPAEDDLLPPAEDLAIAFPDAPRRRLVVTLEATGDTVRDKLRVRRVYHHIMAYPGDDRFAFYIREADRSYLIEYPEGITIGRELLAWLQQTVGAEHVRIEPLVVE